MYIKEPISKERLAGGLNDEEADRVHQE